MGNIIEFPLGFTKAATAMADGPKEPASALDACQERLRAERAAMLPIESYFERMNTVLIEVGEELRIATAHHSICRAALDSGDIELMERARDALRRSIKS
jgi:hypothetical protein